MPTNWDDFSDVVTVGEESPTATNWDAFSDPLNGVDESTVSPPLGQPTLLTPAQRKLPGLFDFAKDANATALAVDPKAMQFKEDIPAGFTEETSPYPLPTQTRAESLSKSKYKTPEELLQAYKESRGWVRTQAEQAAIGLGTGTMAAFVQPVGVALGKITGNTEYLDEASRMGKEMNAIGQVSAEMPSGQFTNKLASAAASILPTILGGGALGFVGSVGAGAAGSMSQTFLDARDAALANGATEEEAQAKAFIPTVASGLSTALATVFIPKVLNKLAPGMFGEGVEAIGVKASGELVKRTGSAIKDFFVNFTKGALGEVPEEMVDQLAQGLIEQASFNPDKTWDEIVADSIEAGKMAFFLGGTVDALSKVGGGVNKTEIGAVSVTPPPPIIQDPLTAADAASASLLAEAEASDSDEVKAQLTAKADFFANPAHQEVLADSVQELSDLQEEAKTATAERKAEIEQEIAAHPLNGVAEITPDNSDAVQAAIAERFKVQQQVEEMNVAVQAANPVVQTLGEQGLTEAAQIIKDNNQVIIKNAVKEETRPAITTPEQVATEQPIAATESTQVAPESVSGVETAQGPVIAPEATKSASMPLMVTREMNQQLSDLGYSKAERNAMSPQAATDIIKTGKSKVTKVAPVEQLTKAENAPVITAEEAAMAGDDTLAEQIETQFKENYANQISQAGAAPAVKDVAVKPEANQKVETGTPLRQGQNQEIATPETPSDVRAEQVSVVEIAPVPAKAEASTESERAPESKVKLRVITRSKAGKVSFKTKATTQSQESIKESLVEAKENDTIYDQILDCLGRKAK